MNERINQQTHMITVPLLWQLAYVTILKAQQK